MPIDKALAEKMLDMIQTLCMENAILKDVLRKKGWTAMDKVLADARSDPDMQARLRKLFDPVRERIQRETDPAEVIQEFLRVLPANQKLN